MTPETLEIICIKRFGKNGKMLYEAMIKIAEKDFCVATGWRDSEVSISFSCPFRGRIFSLSDDYRKIMLPNGTSIDIDELTYLELSKHLPKTQYERGWRHCSVDKR